MKRRRLPASELVESVSERIRPPAGIILGSALDASELAAAMPVGPSTCYQMDLYQADRLRVELAEAGLNCPVVTAPDLWDLPDDFQTLLYPVPPGGERSLKLDLIEQAFHVLRPRGILIVLSPYEKEQLFPTVLKKVFGKVHAPGEGHGAVLWSQRDNNCRPRRRHELTFHVRLNDATSLVFLSRPGTFSYGRFDLGARALIETMTVNQGDHIVDLGCGCGTNGIIAALRSGPQGSVTFIDSNVRAVALAEHNARLNGVPTFKVVASSTIEGLPEESFDLALANPPYFAQSSIASLFIERAYELLRPQGRFYLVTKQPDVLGPMTAEVFGPVEPVERRGYIVLCAVKRANR